MNSGNESGNPPSDIAVRLRSNAVWAAVPAGILLYYGFFMGAWIPPDTSTSAGKGIWLIQLTVQAGGVLLGAAALFCLTGLPVALLFDAAAALATGAGFAFGSLLAFLDGFDTSEGLYLVFGIVFLNSGLRSWREYRESGLSFIRRSGSTYQEPVAKTARSIPDTDSLVSRMKERRLESLPAKDERSALSPDAAPKRDDALRHEPSVSPKSAAPSKPPEGFLAAFGKEEEDADPR